jgi:hypothetical protein
MTLFVYIVLAVAVVTLMYFALRRKRPDEAAPSLEEVNVTALANLMDAGEQAFLAKRLSPRSYRRIHRKRMRVALGYLGELEQALPSRTSDTSHVVLSRARLLIFILRLRVMGSFLLPNMRLKKRPLEEVVAQLSLSTR